MVLDSFAQVPLPPATRTARTTARSALGRHLLPPLRNATAAIAARTRAQCTSSATLALLSLCSCAACAASRLRRLSSCRRSLARTSLAAVPVAALLIATRHAAPATSAATSNAAAAAPRTSTF